jgi:hypothetical protein
VVNSSARGFASRCAPAWRLPLCSASVTVLDKSSLYCWGFGKSVAKKRGMLLIYCSTVVGGGGVGWGVCSYWGELWVSLILPPFCVVISACKRVLCSGLVGLMSYARDCLWNSRSLPLLLWCGFFV